MFNIDIKIELVLITWSLFDLVTRYDIITNKKTKFGGNLAWNRTDENALNQQQLQQRKIKTTVKMKKTKHTETIGKTVPKKKKNGNYGLKAIVIQLNVNLHIVNGSDAFVICSNT